MQALEQLALVQRQSTMAGFYKAAEPSVMEVLSDRKKKGGNGKGEAQGREKGGAGSAKAT